MSEVLPQGSIDPLEFINDLDRELAGKEQIRDPFQAPPSPVPRFVPQASPAKIDNEISKANARTFDLSAYTQHKHSVRYNCNIPDAPASSIYVNRQTWAKMPKGIRVTIEPIF